MRYSPVSDHFAHLAMLGVAALAGAAARASRTDAKIRRALLIAP